jgi:hypothetical protein
MCSSIDVCQLPDLCVNIVLTEQFNMQLVDRKEPTETVDLVDLTFRMDSIDLETNIDINNVDSMSMLACVLLVDACRTSTRHPLTKTKQNVLYVRRRVLSLTTSCIFVQWISP